jgi:hypothetical protein
MFSLTVTIAVNMQQRHSRYHKHFTIDCAMVMCLLSCVSRTRPNVEMSEGQSPDLPHG